MGYTLAQYKDFTDDEFSPIVIDELRKASPLLEMMPFTANGIIMDDRWTYGYKREVSTRSADVRQINTEYTPAIVTAPQRFTTDLSIFGGSFTIDRTMGRNGGVLARNFKSLVDATTRKWADLVINGDANNAGEFDGLDVALAGSSTEYNVDDVIDLSDMTAINANMELFEFMLAEFVALLGREPDAFLVNSTIKPKFSWVVNKWGLYTRVTNEFGRQIDNYRETPFIDIGDVPGSSNPVIPIETRTVNGTEYEGLTDIYAVCFGDQEVHGVSPDEKSRLIRAFEPDFERPGAVHLGEAEMLGTLAVEATKSAAVFRNIKVRATT